MKYRIIDCMDDSWSIVAYRGGVNARCIFKGTLDEVLMLVSDMRKSGLFDAY